MKLRHPKEFLPVAAILAGLAVLSLYVAAAAGWLKEGSASFRVAETLRFVRVPEAASASSTPIAVLPEPDRTRPVAVMIDNHPDALPAFGLADASYVYEALVEGGLTRVMAVFGSASSSKIGPVRSARPYFIDWAREHEAVYAHVGGSDEALRILSGPLGALDDANEFRYGASFWRDPRRRAPHSTFTSMERLRDLISARGWTDASDSDVLTLRSELIPDGQPASTIHVKFGNGGSYADFSYDHETKTYRHGDHPEAAPTTVVAIDVAVTNVPDPQGKGLIGLKNVGEGAAWIFRDGLAARGAWTKKDAASRLEIRDENGDLIPYAFGQVWIAAYAGNRGGGVTFTNTASPGTPEASWSR